MLVLLLFSTGFGGLAARAQSFTVDVGVPPPSPSVITNRLVAHEASWHWRRGTNEPQSDWKTTADAGLDPSWRSGLGGFGYGDPDILGETTTITGMNEVHTTLFIRREFEVPLGLDPSAPAFLTVDFDDGFVAYLDGKEVARSNAPGAVNSVVHYDALATGSHEASCCTAPTSTATNLALGDLGTLLKPGTHVLSLIGLNRALTNSDFHLIPDLSIRITDPSSSNSVPPVVNHGLYAISTTNQVRLSGSNTLAEASRVVVNGLDADWDAVAGRWSRNQFLTPGMNRMFIAALDSRGRILTNLTQDVVYQTNLVVMGGALASDQILSGPGVVVQVEQDLTVGTGLHLRIEQGVVVRLAGGVKLLAQAGGKIDVSGTRELPLWVLPADGSLWGELAADGAGAQLHIRHAEITRGAVKFRNGAEGLMEDTYHHHYQNGTVPIAGCTAAASVVVRRCHFQVYHETLWQSTPMLVEDSLFEDANNTNSDALDFDTAPPGSVIRRCTFRRGPNTNTDACDIGSGSLGVLIESCIMRGFPNDKGVSIGEDSFGIIVRNNLMWGNDSGVAVKDSCTAIVEGNTIVDCDFGFRLYNKATPASATGGGHITNAANNIVWGNRRNFEILNGGTMVSSYSDVQDTNFPGVGNLSIDPLFRDASRRDYRLQSGSPCLSTGLGGSDMGVQGPVGGIPVEPARLAATDPSISSILLTWEDRSDNEDGVIIERSLDGSVWQKVAIALPEATEYRDTSLASGTAYLYRVSCTNTSGLSAWSNLARGVTIADVIHVGGTLKADATWSGIIVVDSNVTVPGPFTLRVLPGSWLRFADGASLTAVSGGKIEVMGSEGAKVRLEGLSSGTGRWGDLLASGAGSSVVLSQAQMVRGRVRVISGGSALVEDSELSQMSTTGIIGGSGGTLFVVRRSHVHDYEDIDLINTVTLAEDSLFERARSDIFELQSSPPGSVLRRCVFRDCLNPNSDGIDMNGCRDVRIESCQVYRVTDKGISSGSASSASDPTSTGLVVSNSVVYQAAIGIAVKDGGTAALYNNAFSQLTEGIALYAKFTKSGGVITDGADNIIWGVTNAVRVSDGGSVTLKFSDVQGGWVGQGNIAFDPLWLDPAAGDFRLGVGSPCVGSGRDGGNMGPQFNSLRLELVRGLDGKLRLSFQAQPGIRYALYSTDLLEGPWMLIQDLGLREVSGPVEVEVRSDGARGYFRIVVVVPTTP